VRQHLEPVAGSRHRTQPDGIPARDPDVKAEVGHHHVGPVPGRVHRPRPLRRTGRARSSRDPSLDELVNCRRSSRSTRVCGSSRRSSRLGAQWRSALHRRCAPSPPAGLTASRSTSASVPMLR
jgi:hypothetical protein